MKVFEFAGVIFNVDNICTIQKVNLVKENGDKSDTVPGLQIVTIAGGMNFSFATEKERDEKFETIISGMTRL